MNEQILPPQQETSESKKKKKKRSTTHRCVTVMAAFEKTRDTQTLFNAKPETHFLQKGPEDFAKASYGEAEQTHAVS